MKSSNHGLTEGKEYNLKVGSSFQSSKAQESYQVLRYDFKPASIDTSKPAELKIGGNNECTVTFPNVHDSGSTTYKGGKKPCTKECVLIIDKNSGEITLERIASNIPLKRSRTGTIDRSGDIRNKSGNTSHTSKNIPSSGKSSKTAKTSPPTLKTSPQTTASTPSTSSSQQSNNSNISDSQSSHSSSIQQPSNQQASLRTNAHQTQAQQPKESKQPTKEREISSPSSSGSSSSDSSDSDTDYEADAIMLNNKFNEIGNAPPPNPPPSDSQQSSGRMPNNTLLNTDLQLSDSNDSDSD